MGILLDFVSAPRPSARVEPRRAGGRTPKTDAVGEVIPFPGVRYERMALDLAARIGTIGKVAGPTLSEQD